jgi:dTDP-4-amino-4,6-dideoxygalactose transaminase
VSERCWLVWEFEGRLVAVADAGLLHYQPAYRDTHGGAPLPVSEDLVTRIMALPIHPDMTEADVARVCDAVLALV